MRRTGPICLFALMLVVTFLVLVGCTEKNATPTPARQSVSKSITPAADPARQPARLPTLPVPRTAPAAGSETNDPTPRPAAASDAGWVERAMRATVMIWIVTDRAEAGRLLQVGTCSGSVVDPNGLILTNWHCVGLTADADEDESGLGLRPGDTYHSQKLIVVGITEDPTVEPSPTYVAQVREGSPELDFAVAKIVGMVDASQKLPKSLALTAVGLGDSDTVKLGDTVHVFGYPGIGGPLITKTKGEIAGFYKAFARRPDLKVDSFKTDAMSAPGASGGLVTNDQGLQIAIHDFGRAEAESGARFGGEIFINLAKPYIGKARQNVAEPAASVTAKPAPRAQEPPIAAPAAAAFGAIAFGTDYREVDGLLGEATSFPAGTKRVIAAFSYQGMRSGAVWGNVLLLDGEPVVDKRNKVWDGGADGQTRLSFSNDNDPLPEGTYELVLSIGGKDVQRGTFVIEAIEAPAADARVTVQGQVIDTDTKRGVGGAVFAVLDAGITSRQWANAKMSSAMVAAWGETAPDGTFRANPPLERGESYTIAILADGYKVYAKDVGLTITESDPATLKLKVIAIQRR